MRVTPGLYAVLPVLALVVAAACNDSASPTSPSAPAPVFSGKGGAGGGGVTPPVAPPAAPPTTPAPAPSGGTQIPPSPKVDGPAWFFAEFGDVAGPMTANINFDEIQNQVPGGISIGANRNALEVVYNVSKKTPLTITNITFLGANPADFSIPAAELAAVTTTVIPANKGQGALLHITFSPTASGPRSATLQVTSAAGIAQIFLTGTALPNRPIIAPIGPLAFLPASAPDNLVIQNLGGQTLSLNSFTIIGAKASAFSLFGANNGFSNCFPGVLLAPHSFCFLAVGVAPGATAPSSATLEFLTNDPVTPKLDVPLTLTP
jgi:hypothetical protein